MNGTQKAYLYRLFYVDFIGEFANNTFVCENGMYLNQKKYLSTFIIKIVGIYKFFGF